MASHGFSGVAWCYFIKKKHELMARLLLLLQAKVYLFWFVAPFTWLNSLICWCLWSCFESVTTSVTSSRYCETFLKTAFIKRLLNRETKTLLLIISCSPVCPSVEDVSWDFLSSVNSSWTPLKAKQLLLSTLAVFGAAHWEQFRYLNLAGRQHSFSLCASHSYV